MATHFIQLEGGSIAYQDEGQGPLMVLAPSLGDLRAEYRFLVPRLVAAGFRVVSVDLRGHGESSAIWPAYTVSDVGADFLALIRHLDAGPAILLGTSMSAGAAVWAAAEAPALISGLVLVSPFVRDTMPLWQSRLMFSPLFVKPWGPAVWAKYYRSLYPHHPPEDIAAYLEALKDNFNQPGRMRAVRAMITASKAESEARLSQVTAPAWIIMGAQDPDFKDPAAEARLIAGRLPGGARIEMVDHAGHYPHAEQPETTAGLVIASSQQFLQEAASVA